MAQNGATLKGARPNQRRASAQSTSPYRLAVIPAKAEPTPLADGYGIPAYAGMTVNGARGQGQ